MSSAYIYDWEYGELASGGVTASFDHATEFPSIGPDYQTSITLTLDNLPAHYAMAVEFGTQGHTPGTPRR